MLILRYGDEGQIAGDVQQALAVGLDVTRKIDGPTLQALRAFQAQHGLQVDGAAGPATLSALACMPVAGIDVSHWQGKIDWQRVKAAGIAFAYVKASQNQGGVDPNFAANVKGARAAGIPVGAYHYADPRVGDAAAEAAQLVKVAGKLDLPAVLDLESNGGKLTPDQMQTWSLQWLDAVGKATGKAPLLYTYRPFLQTDLGGGDKIAAAGTRLWIARYRGEGATDPGSLSAFKRWTCWQYTGSGSVDGITGKVDRNWLAGTVEALAAS